MLNLNFFFKYKYKFKMQSTISLRLHKKKYHQSYKFYSIDKNTVSDICHLPHHHHHHHHHHHIQISMTITILQSQKLTVLRHSLKVSRKTVVYTDKVKNQVTREEEHKGSREVKIHLI